MSRHLGWPERHNVSPDALRQIADTLENLQHDNPQPIPWSVDVVAPSQVWIAMASLDSETPTDD